MSCKASYILDFEPPDEFVVILDRQIVTGAQKYKDIVLNGVTLNDNIRILTNKGFLIEILKKKESDEFMFRLILVNVLRNNTSPPIGFGDDFSDFITILNNIIS